MENESIEWVSRALHWEDPERIRSAGDLIARVNREGFLPLFANDVPGFSVEERTLAWDWWSDDPVRDPWLWREVVARGGQLCYGKFFDGKAGFISRAWLGAFANYRRDGYDFDALWEDGRAHYRLKKLMDCFTQGEERFSFELRNLAGFGKGGEAGFEGAVATLQRMTYLVIRDFRQRRNRLGEYYGWPITVYATPESVFGEETVTACYSESPAESWARIWERARELCPGADEKALKKLLK